MFGAKYTIVPAAKGIGYGFSAIGSGIEWSVDNIVEPVGEGIWYGIDRTLTPIGNAIDAVCDGIMSVLDDD